MKLEVAAMALFVVSVQADTTLIDVTFDGVANEVGPAIQVVENNLDDATPGSFDSETGVIQTGERSGTSPTTHALGINSIGTVDLSGFSGFTATFTVDSLAINNVSSLRANGLFFGVVSGTDATGTAGTSLWNNFPQAIGYVAGSVNHGDHQFAANVGGSTSATTNVTALTTTAPTNAAFSDGFTISFSVFDDDTWQISSIGLETELNDSGSLNGVDYATFSQGVGLYTSLQGEIGGSVDLSRLTLTGIGAELLQLTINPNSENDGNYDFVWTSAPGRTYALVSSTDLSVPLSSWSVWDERSDLTADSSSSNLTNVPGGTDSKRFFAIVDQTP